MNEAFSILSEYASMDEVRAWVTISDIEKYRNIDGEVGDAANKMVNFYFSGDNKKRELINYYLMLINQAVDKAITKFGIVKGVKYKHNLPRMIVIARDMSPVTFKDFEYVTLTANHLDGSTSYERVDLLTL